MTAHGISATNTATTRSRGVRHKDQPVLEKTEVRRRNRSLVTMLNLTDKNVLQCTHMALHWRLNVHHDEYAQYHTRVRQQILEMVYVNHAAQTNIRTCTYTIRHTHETFISIDKRANTHIHTHTHTHNTTKNTVVNKPGESFRAAGRECQTNRRDLNGPQHMRIYCQQKGRRPSGCGVGRREKSRQPRHESNC